MTVAATSPASAPRLASPGRKPSRTVSVSVAIMAHPKRRSFIPGLQAKLDRHARLVLDECNDRWDTGRRSMLAYDPAATHHFVLQDDGVIPRDLVAGIERALPYVPDGSPMCLYLGTVRPWPTAVKQLVTATKDDTSWIVMNQLNWGVGVVVPTCHIDEMIAWCDKRTDVANYDKRMSRWFEHQGIPIWYPWPSLVDHRDSPSLVAGRTGHRVAHRFVGADASVLSQRFDGQVMTMSLSSMRRVGTPAPVSRRPGTVEYMNVHTGKIRRVVGSSTKRFDRAGCWVRADRAERCETCGQMRPG